MHARIAIVLLAAACAKGGPAQQPVAPTAPEPSPAPPPVVEKAPPDSGELTVTTASPEALGHFKTGRALVDNQRFAESAEHFKKALELDPTFAQAAAYLGSVTPGSEGIALIDKAVAMAEKIPEPERQYIEVFQAQARNDNEKAKDLLRKVVAARPRAWRAQLQLAGAAFNDENWDEAGTASKQALDASPEASVANNYLAYSLAWQGRYPEALEVSQKQITALPEEPNPQDTQGEILLAAGKLDEALAAFDKAVAMSPKFSASALAAAAVHVYKGDWKGAYASTKRAHDDAPRALDAIQAAVFECWLLAAQGKLADAQKIYDALDKKAAEEKLEGPSVVLPAGRGFLLSIAGKPKDALRALDAADARLKAATSAPAATQRDAATLITQGRLIVAMKQKKGADADKLMVQLEEQAKKLPMNRGLQSALDFGAGLTAWAKGDPKGAAASLAKCSFFDYPCRFMLVGAQRAAGDKAGAAETLAKLKASPRRDATYVYFWATTK